MKIKSTKHAFFTRIDKAASSELVDSVPVSDETFLIIFALACSNSTVILTHVREYTRKVLDNSGISIECQLNRVLPYVELSCPPRVRRPDPPIQG